MSLLVTGSIGIDTVTTPHGTADSVLGGSAIYFSFAAGFFTTVRLVGVVGEDFPDAFRQMLVQREIDIRGLETRVGSETFRWTGAYEGDMNEAQTRDVALNVLAEAGPKVPAEFADSKVVFLANTHPALQRELLAQVTKPSFVVCDTMNLWIENERDELLKTLRAVDGVIINDAEAKQLTGKVNLVEVGEALLELGPRIAVVKKGEHGAMLVTRDSITTIPAFPTKQVCDPTGAGDSFAGGMLGYLTSVDDYSTASLRRAVARGTVASSFTIEGFSLDRILQISRDDIDKRVEQFVSMLRID
jgi:sugar/nucleoside kinase (ribokinase family)